LLGIKTRVKALEKYIEFLQDGGDPEDYNGNLVLARIFLIPSFNNRLQICFQNLKIIQLNNIRFLKISLFFVYSLFS